MELIEYLQEFIFLDIETVSDKLSYDDLDERMQLLWDKKAKQWDASKSAAELYPKAALLPEFGKIIVIGVGFFHQGKDREINFRVKAFKNDDEKVLLTDFKNLVEKKFKSDDLRFVAHNGKGFDFPYLARRMMVQGIRLPKALQLYGKSPWQIPHVDTMEMWRMGDIRTFVSLDLLTALFELPSSKTALDGGKVNETYYHEKDLEKIAQYCLGDVVATARVYLRMMSIPDLKEENIIYTP